MSLLTGEEAKKRWCPFARVPDAYSETVTLNRDGVHGPAAGTYCLASGCMAWIQGGPAIEKKSCYSGEVPDPADGWQLKKELPSAGRSLFLYERDLRKDEGYCGLAGRVSE